MMFTERLGALANANSLEAERVFQSLRPDVGGNESTIIDRFELETNDQARHYLLALLSESKTDIALRALRSHAYDKDSGTRSWARYGVERITNERFQNDCRNIEEADARLVIYPARWRVYLVGGSIIILALGMALMASEYARVALG